RWSHSAGPALGFWVDAQLGRAGSNRGHVRSDRSTLVRIRSDEGYRWECRRTPPRNYRAEKCVIQWSGHMAGEPPEQGRCVLREPAALDERNLHLRNAGIRGCQKRKHPDLGDPADLEIADHLEAA